MRNIKNIEESIVYFKKKFLELPDESTDQELRRIERIYYRRIEVLEEFRNELLDDLK